MVPDNNYSFWPCALSQVHFNRFATWQHRVIVEQCHEALLCFSLVEKREKDLHFFRSKVIQSLVVGAREDCGNVNAV